MVDGKKCILIADDEKEIRDVLNLLLSGEGYHIVCAEDGQSAVSLAGNETDLMILDVNMPRMNGFSACAEIRKRFDIPVIFLTAYSGESDKVMGFSVGADDYIIKPFSNIELLMRVKAVLRRGRAAAEPGNSASLLRKNLIPLADVFLDPDSHSIIKDGDSVALTYTEFKIIELLLLNRKRISLWTAYMKVFGEKAPSETVPLWYI